jgi:hypothetical protein
MNEIVNTCHQADGDTREQAGDHPLVKSLRDFSLKGLQNQKVWISMLYVLRHHCEAAIILSASYGNESAVTSISPKISTHCSFSQTEHHALLKLQRKINIPFILTQFGH